MVFQLAPTEMIVGLLTPVASLYLGLMAWGYRAKGLGLWFRVQGVGRCFSKWGGCSSRVLRRFCGDHLEKP